MVHMTEPKGFRFIQAFVHMMKYHAHTHHLLDIITKVRGLFVMTTYTPVHHVVRLVTRQVPLVEQELLTLAEHPS